jgi:hypothetical protein
MLSKITHGPGNLRAPGRVSLTMAIVIASQYSSEAGLTADSKALGSAASRIGEVADLLSSTGPPQPAVLRAGVPQAARLEAALTRARQRQADSMSTFTVFYRASAATLTDTASRMARAEEDASMTFRTVRTGGAA